MTNLIGNKTQFGIEYEVTSTEDGRLGRIRLWLDGKYLGSIDDIGILSVTVNQLGRLLEKPDSGEEFLEKSSDEILELSKAGSIENGGRLLISLGESFDDFYVLAFRNRENIRFFWKLNESSFFSYHNYPPHVMCADVPVEQIRRVVSDFERAIEK